MRKFILGILMLPLLLTGCGASSSSNQISQSTSVQNDSQITAKQISTWTYKSGDKPVKIINNDRPTIKASDFEQSHIKYGGLDNLNRTKTATAYLKRNNLGRSNTRTEQVWRPTGWHNQPRYIDGTRVIPQNRGHLIAYTMTFNLNKDGRTSQGELGSIDNPYNLFTQTEFSNQKTMTETEQLVRNALAKNKKVVYQVTPIFRNNELMARGVWVQALSTDGSLKFNRYIWNVQNKIVFDYSTGRSTINKEFIVPGIMNNYHYQNKSNNHYRSYKRNSY